MRVAIVGSRTWRNGGRVREYVIALRSECFELGEPLTIVSGGADGVDTMAEATADELSIPVALYLPCWEKYGKRAGFIRNQEIVDNADRVIAFWDGESHGTKHTIDLTLKARKHLEVVFP